MENYLRILAARPNHNGIFIMHDRPEFNVGIDGPLEMTKILVPRLRAHGYKFATLDDLLGLPPPIAPPPARVAASSSLP